MAVPVTPRQIQSDMIRRADNVMLVVHFVPENSATVVNYPIDLAVELIQNIGDDVTVWDPKSDGTVVILGRGTRFTSQTAAAVNYQPILTKYDYMQAYPDRN